MLGFLDLPGEIRNQIYFELLIVPDLSPPRLVCDPSLHPRILEVCKEIHHESKQVLYGKNSYLAHPNLLTGLPRLRLHYDAISSYHLISLISRYHIRVRLDCDPNFSAQKASDAFSGIEELTIEVFQATFGGSDYEVLTLFEEIRGVKKVKIYGSVIAFPDYVIWLRKSMMMPKGSFVAKSERPILEEVKPLLVEK